MSDDDDSRPVSPEAPVSPLASRSPSPQFEDGNAPVSPSGDAEDIYKDDDVSFLEPCWLFSHDISGRWTSEPQQIRIILADEIYF